MKSLLMALLLLCTSAFAQPPQAVKFFEATVIATINGKPEQLKTVLIESRPSRIQLTYQQPNGTTEYSLQLTALRKLSPISTRRTTLLQTQIFLHEQGRKLLIAEPTIEALEGSQATLSVAGAESSIYISLTEVQPGALVSTCSQVRGKPITAAELSAALQRLDQPTPNAVDPGCCAGGCGGSVSIRCCGVLCCSVSTNCGCCIEP